MSNRFRTVGIVLATLGLVFIAVAGVAFSKVQDGYGALGSFSEAQDVRLTYNDDGQLTDRGTTEGAAAIMTLLTDEWGYSVVGADLDSDDPVVNTATEYMFQMATIGYHILNGTQTVVLDKAVEYEGGSYPAGSNDFAVDGRYWTDFDRQHPIEGPARSLAWSGTAHGLFAELGVGAVTHSALQLGLAISGAFAALGLMALLAGSGLIWASLGKDSARWAIAEITNEMFPTEPVPVG